MIKLIFADLRYNAATWAGAFVVAVACGFLGGWVASFFAMGQGSLNYTVLAFTIVAAIAVVAAIANLTVSAQRRSYALWQLVGVSPRRVSNIVLAQLAVVGALGALCGTAIEAATITPLFPLVFASPAYAYMLDVPINVGVSLMPWVWVAVAITFVLGGIRGAKAAGKTPAIVYLRGAEDRHKKMTWARIVMFAALAIASVTIAMSLYTTDPTSDGGWSASLFLPVTIAAALAAAAPIFLPGLLHAWSALLPNRLNAWYLARHKALYDLDAGGATELPVVVGAGIVAGVFSLLGVLQGYINAHDLEGMNATLDSTSAILLLGGPVLLAAVGSAASMVMVFRQRINDVSLLSAVGASPGTVVASSACEAVVHAVNSAIAATLVGLVTSAIVSTAAGMSVFSGLALGEGGIVVAVGFVLMLLASVIPTALTFLGHHPIPSRET